MKVGKEVDKNEVKKKEANEKEVKVEDKELKETNVEKQQKNQKKKHGTNAKVQVLENRFFKHWISKKAYRYDPMFENLFSKTWNFAFVSCFFF